MRSSVLTRIAPAALLALLITLPLSAAATAAVAPAPGASAEAYGVFVDVKLLPVQVPVRAGPISHAAQDYPPGANAPDSDSVAELGPLPDDASLVKHVGVLTTLAGANAAPQAAASAQAADVSLLADAAGVPAISADLVRAQANSSCTAAPNATGTTFVNLSVGGQPIEGTPPPNTVIDLQVAKVILNEQHPASDGRGIVVNALHVISTTTGDPLFRGDIVVAHAMSTVACPNGAPSTGGNNEVQITKSVSPTTAAPGDTLTYTATITNKAAADCLVTAAIDHLPVGFEFVSTSGGLGTALDITPPQARPGGGLDLVLGNGKVIAPNASVNQTFVVKVGADVAPGVYFNNVELFCANLGNFVKGLDAPVTVTAPPAAAPTPTTAVAEPPAPSFGGDQPVELPRTGSTPALGLTALALLGAATLLMWLRHVRHTSPLG